MKDVTSMSDEELRIEIAEFCGLKTEDVFNGVKYELPNYPSSLDAMWEAETKLNPIQCHKYQEVLMKDVVTLEKLFLKNRAHPMEGFVIHATAKQRAIAFVKTIREIKTK